MYAAGFARGLTITGLVAEGFLVADLSMACFVVIGGSMFGGIDWALGLIAVGFEVDFGSWWVRAVSGFPS